MVQQNSKLIIFTSFSKIYKYCLLCDARSTAMLIVHDTGSISEPFVKGSFREY